MNPAAKQVPDGVLLTSKPKDWTSFDVVRQIKSLVRPVKVGHIGTLDPMATGLLPLTLGEATKLARWLIDGAKRYRARVCLGVATDTLDAKGKPVARADVPKLDEESTDRVLMDFRGPIEQVPPMFSAAHHCGERLYKLARRGVEVERKAKKVEIFDLQLLDLGPDFLELDVTCSAGTYIRSLAQDIGVRLGTKAHLSALERTEAAGFMLESAVDVHDLDRDGVVERMLDLEHVLTRFERIDVPEKIAMRLAQGNRLEEAELSRLNIEAAPKERIVWFRPPKAAPIVVVKLMPAGSSPALKIMRVLRRPDTTGKKH